MNRADLQKVLDGLMPGLRLPDPRTEEELLTELQPITELEELREEIHTETIIAMYLGDQLNLKKKFIHELYERERALKNEMA